MSEASDEIYRQLRQAMDLLHKARLDSIHHATDKAALRNEIERLRAALTRSMIAIDDWLQTYAAELCDPARVEEAAQRIGEYGTLSYIAQVQEQNRAALSPSHSETP